MAADSADIGHLQQTKDADALQRWQRLGEKWQGVFLVQAGSPELGSWVDPRFTKNGSVTLGCRCCSFARVVLGSFANYRCSTARAMQSENFKKHQRSHTHKSAVLTFLADNPDEALGAPPAEDFTRLCDKILQGVGTCSDVKSASMTWCLSEALKCADQRKVNKAKMVALFRDESKGKLALRFRAVLPDLSTHSGVMGIATNFGSGGLHLTKATLRIMQRFCSRFHAAPGRAKQKSFVKKGLLQRLRHSVTTITVDSAADEVLSSEMLRSCALSGLGRRITPNLKFVIRDKTHGSRRIISRGIAADAFLTDVMHKFCRSRSSVARIVQSSTLIRARFQALCRTSFKIVRSTVTNMRAAAHRYESLQKPFGRSVLFIHACVRTALWTAQTRNDESSASSKAWLTWVSEERCLQAAMLADASDQTLALTRILDKEAVDPAIINAEVRSYVHIIEALFGEEERCLTVFGYTRAMMETLRTPLVWDVKGKVRSLGSDGGVQRETVLRCLGRMRSWSRLAAATIAVEFPSFELCYAVLFVLLVLVKLTATLLRLRLRGYD